MIGRGRAALLALPPDQGAPEREEVEALAAWKQRHPQHADRAVACRLWNVQRFIISICCTVIRLATDVHLLNG
jgi:hypothetical protein